MDISAEELNNSVPARVALQSDIKTAADSLAKYLSSWKYDYNSDWWIELRAKCARNQATVKVGLEI